MRRGMYWCFNMGESGVLPLTHSLTQLTHSLTHHYVCATLQQGHPHSAQAQAQLLQQCALLRKMTKTGGAADGKHHHHENVSGTEDGMLLKPTLVESQMASSASPSFSKSGSHTHVGSDHILDSAGRNGDGGIHSSIKSKNSEHASSHASAVAVDHSHDSARMSGPREVEAAMAQGARADVHHLLSSSVSDRNPQWRPEAHTRPQHEDMLSTSVLLSDSESEVCHSDTHTHSDSEMHDNQHVSHRRSRHPSSRPNSHNAFDAEVHSVQMASRTLPLLSSPSPSLNVNVNVHAINKEKEQQQRVIDGPHPRADDDNRYKNKSDGVKNVNAHDAQNDVKNVNVRDAQNDVKNVNVRDAQNEQKEKATMGVRTGVVAVVQGQGAVQQDAGMVTVMMAAEKETGGQAGGRGRGRGRVQATSAAVNPHKPSPSPDRTARSRSPQAAKPSSHPGSPQAARNRSQSPHGRRASLQAASPSPSPSPSPSHRKRPIPLVPLAHAQADGPLHTIPSSPRGAPSPRSSSSSPQKPLLATAPCAHKAAHNHAGVEVVKPESLGAAAADGASGTPSPARSSGRMSPRW
jgi:hypothetical protein